MSNSRVDTPKIARNSPTALALQHGPSTSLRGWLGPLLVTESICCGNTKARLGPFSRQACDPAGGAPVQFCSEFWKRSTWSIAVGRERGAGRRLVASGASLSVPQRRPGPRGEVRAPRPPALAPAEAWLLQHSLSSKGWNRGLSRRCPCSRSPIQQTRALRWAGSSPNRRTGVGGCEDTREKLPKIFWSKEPPGSC